MKKHLLVVACLFFSAYFIYAQPATVSMPVGLGRNVCSGGSSANNRINYFNYLASTNTLTNASTPAACAPVLRFSASNTTNRFSNSAASISFNPKDQMIYYIWTDYSLPSPYKSYVWRWAPGTCPNPLDTLRSFNTDIGGVTFDANGNGWLLEFLGPAPYKSFLSRIDFTTGIIGQKDTLALTGGAVMYSVSSGDITLTPSGQMFYVFNNKLFSPDYPNYGGPAKKITCTYIDTVRAPAASALVGLAYADGELVAAYSPGCTYREVNPMTGDTALVVFSPATFRTSDFAQINSGIGVSKRLVSATPTGTANEYNVVYDVYVKNYGNVPVTNVQVTDDLGLINGAGNVSNVSVSFQSNPAGLVLNAGYTGVGGGGNIQLLNGTGTLPNFPVASNTVVIRISCRLQNIASGVVYNNRAIATGNGFTNAALRDSSTDGTQPDLNTNDKPDDFGESRPTPLLISVAAQTPPCTSLSQVLYSQNFGSGTGMTTVIPGSVSTGYTGSTVAPMATDRYTITNNANNGNTTDWINLTDNTGGVNGRMMLVNADNTNSVFYRDTIAVVCPNQQYSFFFYAAFIGNASYQTVCNAFGGFKYPRVLMRIRDAATGLIITSIASSDISSTSWAQYGLKWVMPSGFTSVIFEMINDGQGGCGNDIALDDIQFGTCDALPSVSVSAPAAGCLGSSTTMSSTLSDPGAIPGSKEYQWQISTDGSTWSDISGATSADLTLNPIVAGDVNKYYRVLVAATGNIGSASCRYTSPSFFLTAKTASTAPTSALKNRGTICPGDAVTLTRNGGTLGTNAAYTWYSTSCGGTLLGTGNSIVVSPNVTTTYYVRIEGDCNVTACVPVTVTVSCDIDDDNDGIPDVVESGGVDPLEDADSDGLENYRDADFAGFTDVNSDGINDVVDYDSDGIINELDLDSDNDGVPDVVEAYGVDANGDGRIDNYADTDADGFSQNVDGNITGHISSGTGLNLPDLDGDGVPNYFDLDSDNDGIPDVREANGTDADNDGKIDSYTDTDADGLSDNVDGDVGNDGTAENAANTLLRTGSDSDSDGRANSYPFRNFDGDVRSQPYDLDSDNDGITDVREAGFSDADNNGFCDGVKGSDGWDNSIDAMPTLTIRNTDSDPNLDYMDIDADNDGIPDNIEGPATAGYQFPLLTDTDNDGIDNRYDNVSGFGGNGNSPNDQDSDGVPDYIDSDTDNDSQPDIIEGNDYNLNTLPDDLVTLTGIDTDGDGLDNRFDNNNSSQEGTSLYMGAAGSFSGDASPGSNTMVQRSFVTFADRDWRFLAFVLDVSFMHFSAARTDDVAKLNWIVTCDKIIDRFEIERSTDGINFIKVGEKKGIGASCKNTSFDYYDNMAGTGNVVYYRLKAITTGNAFKQSQYIIIRKSVIKEMIVSPNPASHFVNISLNIAKDGELLVHVLDAAGKVVLRQKQFVHSGNHSISIEGITRLSQGVYSIQVKTADEILHKKITIKR